VPTYSTRGVLWLVAAVIVAAILAGLAVYNVVDRTVAGLGQVRIAVMPFRPPADDAAPDTIVNAILQGFGGTPAAVIGPTTTSRYAGTDADVRRLSDDFGLDFVLNGRFSEDSGAPRLAAELIRASDGAQVWTASYDDVSDGQRIGRDISQQVTRVLALQVSPERR
jgi:TolB-like protein